MFLFATRKLSLAKTLAWFSVLFALTVVLQIWGSAIKIATVSVNLSLIPVVLGGMLLGPLYAAGLGLASGIVTLVAGAIGVDGFTLILFQAHPVITSLICLLKVTAAGFVSSIVYIAVRGKNKLVATFLAAALVPVVNTSLFIVGALTMSGTIRTNFVAEGSTVIYFLVIGCAGVNFLLELAVNLVFSPAIFRVTEAAEKFFAEKFASRPRPGDDAPAEENADRANMEAESAEAAEEAENPETAEKTAADGAETERVGAESFDGKGEEKA